jgi:hypothetical protein
MIQNMGNLAVSTFFFAFHIQCLRFCILIYFHKVFNLSHPLPQIKPVQLPTCSTPVNHVPGMAARGQGSRAGRAVAQAAACAYTTKRRRPKSTHVVARPAAVAAAAASGVAGASGSGQPGDAQRRAPGRRARRGGALLCAPPGSAGSTGSPGRVRAAPASSTGAVNGLAQCVRGGQQADWRGGDGVLTRACVDSGHPQPRLPLRL